ncbi:MAG: KTSC domain-containing protein [Sphingomonadales bacterium]|nr:MAG: KTSC domain-containing protein [Sphingomonadales bacterium]
MPSTVIKRWDYDATAQRLDIWFVSGKQYRYHDVPAEVIDAMRAAFSKGSFYNREIRDRYRFTRC